MGKQVSYYSAKCNICGSEGIVTQVRFAQNQNVGKWGYVRGIRAPLGWFWTGYNGNETWVCKPCVDNME